MIQTTTIWNINRILLLKRRLPILIKNQSIRLKFKRFGDRPPGQILKILNENYETDEWTNIPDKVLELIERPDPLYQTKGNPIYLIKQSLCEHFLNFKYFQFRNPVVSLWQNFDSILVPNDHISRSRTDTFYVNKSNVLRSHTSAHQSQCFQLIAEKNLKNEKFIIIGDVYRRDEVNRTHHAAFHQAEIVQLYSKNDSKIIEANPNQNLFDESNNSRTPECQEKHNLNLIQIIEKDFKTQIESYIRRMFQNEKIQMRWIPAYFPFTHPSWELEIKLPSTSSSDESDDDWLEMLGCGIIEQKILDRDGLSDHIGWALGFGLERLAMLYYSIPDIRLFWTKDSGFLIQFEKLKPFERYRYRPISSFPQKIFDLSFWLPDESSQLNWSENDVHAIILEIGGNLVEQLHLVDQWKRPSDGKKSNCYRIVYRSHERALTNDEVNKIHKLIEKTLVQELNVTIR